MKSQSTIAKIATRLDWPLLSLVFLISGIGILNLQSAASASYGFALHITQMIWVGLGAVVVAITAAIDTRIYERWAYIFYGFVVFLLVLVLIIGTELNGSQRWLNLGFFLMQPSELLKIAVILVTARYFHDHETDQPLTLVELIRPLAIVGIGVAMVLKQPDLGTSLVILAIFFSMVMLQGLRWSSVATIAFIGLVSFPLVWNFGLHDYQKGRIVSFLNLDEDKQGDSWQVRQSIIAFGSGQVWGKGHVSGTQIQKGFVPEHENDFVAANWGEERGFVGMAFLLALYFGLLAWALRISTKARDRFGAFVSVGVAAMLFWHIVINLAMVTGMLPVVGLTLPLLSAGGSSLLTMMMAIGLLLGVSMRR